MIELPRQRSYKTMREAQIEYFWQVYEASSQDINRTAAILRIGRAGVYRYLRSEYDGKLVSNKGAPK